MPSRRIVATVALAASLLVPASALGARTAYVADGNGVTAQLMVGVGGALTPLGAPPLPADSPRRLTMTPDGTSLYVTAGTPGHGVVLQYDVAADGTATPKGIPSVAAGKTPTAIAIDPAGKTIYVGDQGTDDLLQFHIGAGGALEPLATRTLAGPPIGLTVAPGGQRAYMTVEGFVKWMDVGEDGGLDETTLVGFDTRTTHPGAFLTDVVLTPDGSHLFASSAAHGIFGFDVAADGSVTPLDPATTATGAKVTALAISADGNSLYAVTGARAPNPHRLLQYSIGDDGRLTAKDPASQPLGAGPRDLAITPDGRSLYVAAGDLALFDLDATGLATPKTPGAVDLVKANGVVVSPNQAPVARFDAAGAVAGSAVFFDASSASDADGSITRYDWDFGDGNTLANGGPQVGHVYAKAGAYEVRLVVTDNEGASTLTTFTGTSVLGNGSPAAAISRVIQIAEPVLPLPVLPAQPPRPELGESVIVEPAAGRVRVRLPGEDNFVSLRTLRVVPVGSLVDARRGKALLSSIRDRGGSVQQGHFSQGLFQVRQRRSERFITELVLRGDIGPCPRGNSASASARASRKLWGNGRGRFRTRGRYSSGAVRGTRWLVADTCKGTLTVVRRGRVAVRDFTRDLTTVLEKGERYLASPR
jgi:DNA-binding beta-propeller fold protein YncE